MTSNHSHIPKRDTVADARVRIARGSAISEQCDAAGVCASGAVGTEPRIWKVMAMRRKLRMGRYQVSTAELADALLSCVALPSK